MCLNYLNRFFQSTFIMHILQYRYLTANTWPIKIAKTKTPMSPLQVMKTRSSSVWGFGFFPIDVADFVAKYKHLTYLKQQHASHTT